MRASERVSKNKFSRIYVYIFFLTVIEVELRDELGKGEFGVVLEVSALHVVEGCPCSKCLQSRDSEQEDGGGEGKRQHRLHRQNPHVIEGMPMSPSSQSLHNNNNNNNNINNNNRARVSSIARGVSFAEDVKLQEEDSTLSTDHDFDDDELSLSGPEDALQDEDGEIQFLKGYMSKHCFRAGLPRYAVKRLRPDLEPSNQLEAAIDMAGEAKFMASINHPNICKMRGTIGQPGSWDFMIVMDRLKMTLREKMGQWKDELHHSHKGGMFAFLKRSHQHKAAMEDDVFADKLLAVYDIARAMRYLHNHQ